MIVRVLLCTGLVAATACAAASDETTPAEDGRERRSDVPTVSVDGRTTTVSNPDASLWGAAGELVEEASIGAGAGEDAYLLGTITSITASDELVFIADLQAVRIRVYDLYGAHVRDIGAEGSGPGEFRRPWDVGFTADGRLLVRDQGQRRVHAFTPEGQLLDDWPTDRGNRSVITTKGEAYNLQEPILPDENGEVVINVRRYAADGAAGEWEPFPARPPTPLIKEANLLELMAVFLGLGSDWRSSMWVPFGPRVIAEMADDGAMVSGRADQYRFEVWGIDGSVLVVEKEWSPVAISRDEADWYRRRLTAQWRAATDESWTWGDADIPATKGAYKSIVPSVDGRFWVIRELAGEPVPACDDTPDDYYGFVDSPCWKQPLVADVFDGDGRFLGPVPMPDGILLHVRPFIDGDTMIALLEDDEGTHFVRRYRLRIPR